MGEGSNVVTLPPRKRRKSVTLKLEKLDALFAATMPAREFGEFTACIFSAGIAMGVLYQRGDRSNPTHITIAVALSLCIEVILSIFGWWTIGRTGIELQTKNTPIASVINGSTRDKAMFLYIWALNACAISCWSVTAYTLGSD